MAARHLPVPETTTHTISIGSNFATSPEGIVVGYGDTVNFVNNSGSDITIEFLANTPGVAVYPSMSLPVPNGNPNGPVGFTAPQVDAAANYNICVNSAPQNSDPYVIQVGAGPMYVLITESSGAIYFAPPNVAVPLGGGSTPMGYLEMKSEIPNKVVPIYWETTDPFNGMTSSGHNLPVKSGTSTGNYVYSVTPPLIKLAGGGKVIIQN